MRYVRIDGNTSVSELYHSDDFELYHHGVKGMKWGVQKAVNTASENTRRVSRAVYAASIERQRARIERTISRNKAMSKRYNRDYSKQNKSYRDKLKRLEKTRNSKISDLSEADIERGRAMYKTIKNVGISVAVTATTTAIGAAYAPAAVAAKLVGAGVAAVLKNPIDDR